MITLTLALFDFKRELSFDCSLRDSENYLSNIEICLQE